MRSADVKFQIFNNMKLFKNFFAFAAALLIIACAASCNSKKTDNTAEAENLCPSLSVDSLLADADDLLGDTVIVVGDCSHLCKHGGKKAFLVGADSLAMLRCEATAAMGGAFSPDCVGKTLSVKGVVCENRIGEAEVKEMEAQHAKTEGAADHNCSTEAKANGQDSICEFNARMADFRARISDRLAKEGKDYLSFYYLEAVSYDINQ